VISECDDDFCRVLVPVTVPCDVLPVRRLVTVR